MYKNVGSPDRDYEAEWLEAERELAISGLPLKGEQGEFTRDNFIDSLKKASRRIEKSKSSPKQSKT
jgi:hypothetical protein